MYKIIRYNVNQHGKQMQNLLDKYIIPTYIKRMGLTPDQQLKYVECEPALDPNGAFDRKLEEHSLVVVDNTSVIGCQTNYFLSSKMISDEQERFQEIVDCKKYGILHEYCKHRVKMMTEIAKLIVKHPVNEEGAFYIESTIAHPDWRNQNISRNLHSKSVDNAGHKELVIMEGMMPKHLYENSKSWRKPFQIGFKLHSIEFTYDDYACPLWYRPPLYNT